MQYRIIVQDSNGTAMFTCQGDRRLLTHIQAVSAHVHYEPLEELRKFVVKGAMGTFNVLFASSFKAWDWYFEQFGVPPSAVLHRG